MEILSRLKGYVTLSVISTQGNWMLLNGMPGIMGAWHVNVVRQKARVKNENNNLNKNRTKNNISHH